MEHCSALGKNGVFKFPERTAYTYFTTCEHLYIEYADNSHGLTRFLDSLRAAEFVEPYKRS